jgi:imidazole glycerol-phosphate synthase subunit HisH
MIAIVDYGAGNLVSVKKAFDWLRQDCAITSDAGEVERASKIVLPGVGHFASTESLTSSGLREAISSAIGRGVPFLGICVGMQWMFARSEESPETKGLGLLDGQCERFPADVKSPHVGWNSIDVKSSSRLFRGIPSASFVYFTHSFRAPVTDATAACCEYGGRFAAAVERDQFFGVQFHPEKSGETGLNMLKNFCAI